MDLSQRPHRRAARPSIRMLLGALALAVATVPTACGQQGSSPETQQTNPPAAVAPAAIPPVAPVVATSDFAGAIIQVAEKTIPAVVHIEVTERREVANPLYGLRADPFLQHFFGLPKKMPRKLEQELRALGTGMIMDTRGHILTNAHVVAGATEISVLLASGEKYAGTVVGIDEKTDLAVVQIPAKESLPHVTFGDSDRLAVGAWVVAIGHPRGLDQTVTQGIISAKHRTGIKDPTSYEDFLQTDAAINPGNSGGPLITLDGEVIGVNSMIASTSGGSEGIGFAIPSNMATEIAGQLIAHGKVERGWLGVSTQELTPELAKSLGLSSTKGALVADVVHGGPADQAGIRRGDVIVSFAGQSVADAAELRNRAAVTPIGRKVQVTVLRKGERMELSVTMGDLKAATRELVSSVKGRLGVTIRAITPAETNRYGLEPDLGVVIATVDPEGPLGQKGFEKGDLILEIDREPVHGPQEFAAIAEKLTPGKKALVLGLDHRSGNTGYVQVTVH